MSDEEPRPEENEEVEALSEIDDNGEPLWVHIDDVEFVRGTAMPVETPEQQPVASPAETLVVKYEPPQSRTKILMKELEVAADVQRVFFPLLRDCYGRSRNSGGQKAESMELFGYYKGAQTLSGDYFDYRKLGDQWYITISCDVAGKGIPAALFTPVVATAFAIFFRNWQPTESPTDIARFVYLINDVFEEKRFAGRFVRLTLALVNTNTGKSYFVNAGDTDLHIYKNAQRRMVKYRLPESPPVGLFPSDMVRCGTGFKIVTHTLDIGDTVFFLTDGIEGSVRMFRDKRFRVKPCEEADLPNATAHGSTHNKGSDGEYFGIPRIYRVLNSVFNRRRYTLTKYHNPLPKEEIFFDFTHCEGTPQEAVLALASVERVFRLMPPRAAKKKDCIDLEPSVDEFLSKHFDQYGIYFSLPVSSGDEDSTVRYAHLREDEQLDDLTILAMQRTRV